ncbi:hypothetical protein CHS0354_026767 [Potamilus streckersoni]|uniref:tRNA/rRNA methyltransferase SpoU type domain-containing protein n=1 Tax=Potamilus streckersoni TaxID=2493646 RepID=A0AAE0W6J0_9BIVA|nr:hypothetical protein CHS0354_026767 [Potamilus streckersoni]
MTENTDNTRRFKIVLIEPQIPPNTGNVSRTCVATGSELHVVGKTGFSFSERAVRRAGLDYWKNLIFEQHADVDAYMERIRDRRFWLFTTKTDTPYHLTAYRPGDFLIFGSETAGIRRDILERYPDRCRTLPMNRAHVRSLNLSNTVSIVLRELLDIGGNKFWLIFNFENGKLLYVMITSDEEGPKAKMEQDYDGLRIALTEKYGRPKYCSDEGCVWSNAGTIITLAYRSDEEGDYHVNLVYGNYDAMVKQIEEDKRKMEEAL